MRAYIVNTLIGVFAIDENKKVLDFKEFPKNPKEAAEKLKRSEIEILPEEKEIAGRLGRKKIFVVFSNRKEGVRHAEPGNEFENYVRENLRKLAIQRGLVKDDSEYNKFLTQVNLELTKVRIKKAVGADHLIIHAINSIDELDKSINILVERLREWYGLHFPEMDKIIQSHEKFATIVAKFGTREKIDEEGLKQFSEQSMGVDIEDEDVKVIQDIANQILQLYKLREKISVYIEKSLKKIAPNFSEIAGPQLAAKLIAKAGGLDKLSRMPSSTIQLLGAEKALFRYLHGHGKSPRHGLIFSHPLIQNAPDAERGKIARTLAAKLSIASKLDFYKGEYKAPQMKKELEERVKEILSSRK